MTVEGLLAERVRWWAEAPVSGQLRDTAGRCLMDFLACAVLGSHAAPLATASGSATRITRASIGSRSWLECGGALAHSLEWDDTIVRSVVHPAVVVIPPALVAAVENDASVETLLRAIGAGYDVVGYLGEVIGDRAYARWVHPTAMLGPFGGAAAAAVAAHRADAFADAAGLLPSMVSGSMSFLDDGAWTKAWQVSWAGIVAQRSLELSGSGWHLPRRPFTGRGALGAAFGVEESDWGTPWWEIGAPYLEATTQKPYPSCRLTHGAIEAALQLQKAASDEPITEIRVALHPRAVQIVGEPCDAKRSAVSLVARQFSVHHVVAIALHCPEQLVARLLNPVELSFDDSVVKLAQRVIVEADSTIPLDGARVTVQTSGDRRSAVVVDPSGSPSSRLTAEMLRAKWVAALGDRTDAVLADVESVLADDDAPVARLLRTLREDGEVSGARAAGDQPQEEDES